MISNHICICKSVDHLPLFIILPRISTPPFANNRQKPLNVPEILANITAGPTLTLLSLLVVINKGVESLLNLLADLLSQK